MDQVDQVKGLRALAAAAEPVPQAAATVESVTGFASPPDK